MCPVGVKKVAKMHPNAAVASRTRYTPTQRKNLATHTFRRQIMDLIESHPGIIPVELVKKLECSRGAIRYHVDLLCKEGFLHSFKQGKNRHLFHHDIPESDLETIGILIQRRAIQFAENVIKNPGIGQSDITRAIDASRKVLRAHIDKLIELDLVVEIRKDGRCRYWPTDRLTTIMDLLQRCRKHAKSEDSPGTPPSWAAPKIDDQDPRQSSDWETLYGHPDRS